MEGVSQSSANLACICRRSARPIGLVFPVFKKYRLKCLPRHGGLGCLTENRTTLSTQRAVETTRFSFVLTHRSRLETRPLQCSTCDLEALSFGRVVAVRQARVRLRRGSHIAEGACACAYAAPQCRDPEPAGEGVSNDPLGSPSPLLLRPATAPAAHVTTCFRWP